ncbi:MAG: alpha/beta hydrolase [Gammaproteobacteria bacterium]|nr:MAG: alpha/beta hydrolase [Gammaproteobacteria bacterium]RLA54319.1 MAG: alpha/beta hydrolase [Gammaproteobacteria bacterium]
METTAMDLRTFKTPKADIHLIEGGSGPDLLFLHGAGGITKEDPFLAALAEKYHVYAPLLPGYGDSEESTEIRTMLDFTLHAHDTLMALGLDKPIVVGHSMGGMIAAELAAIAPNDIDKLCLIASAGLWLDDHPIPDVFATMPYELPELLFHDPEAGGAMMTAGADFSDPEFLTAFLIQNARQLGMAGKILFPVPDRGLSERLYRVKAKTVLVWGESDKLIGMPYGEAFNQAIAGSELVKVPEAGHMIIIEQTAAVLAAIAKLG